MDFGQLPQVNLETLAHQLAELRESLTKLQVDTRKRLVTLETSAAERARLVEDRVATLEHDRDQAVKVNANAFESLSARVTDLGVELARWPLAHEVHASLQHIQGLAASCTSQQEAIRSLEDALHGAVGDFEETRSRLDAAIDEGAKATDELQAVQKQLKCAVQECRQQCRGDLDEVCAALWGEARFSLKDLDKLVLQAGCTQSLASTLDALQPLAPRLDALERNLEELSVNKADKNHIHDRLISADGRTSFAV